MSQNLTAAFASRRDAELAVERLVQEFRVERTDIFVAPQGADNSAGEEPDGAENEAADPSPAARDDAALSGSILVSVDLQDDADVATVQAVLTESGVLRDQ